MIYHYFGIDAPPPKRTVLFLLLSSGQEVMGNATHPDAIAWALPERNLLKEQCQVILRGLPELRMISAIADSPVLSEELHTALLHYDDTNLSNFTGLIRKLDIKAHNGKKEHP